MSSIPPIITPPPPSPPKSGNKFVRWLRTSTGKGAVTFAAAGAAAIASPEVGNAIASAADSLSKGQAAGVVAAGVSIILGILRARSA